MIPNDRDLALQHLADDEAALRARVRSLEEDVFWYRALLQRALAELHDLQDVRRLRDENRELREQLMFEDAMRAA